MTDDIKDSRDLLSPYQRKVIGYTGFALAAALAVFAAGIEYGQWLVSPISVLEQKLNEDDLPDLRILDRELNSREYVGTPDGTYQQKNYNRANLSLPTHF